MSKLVTITYNESEILSKTTLNNSEILYNNQIVFEDFVGIKTLNCSDKIMASDVTIDSKNLKCNKKLMCSNVIVNSIGIVGDKPTNLTPSETYTGSTITNGYTTPENVVITGNNNGIDAGTYIAIYTPDSNYCWSDGTTDSITITLTINKAVGEITLSSTAISVYSTETITATFTGDGNRSVLSADTNIATTSISDDIISISRANKGTTTITVTLDEGTNYLSTSATIEVITVLVPTDYQQVEYLQGDGYNTYINSGVYSSTSLNFEVQCLFTRECLGTWISEMVFGVSDSSSAWPSNSCAIFRYRGDAGETAGCIQGASSGITGINVNLNTIYTFTRSGVYMADGSCPIALFAHNAGWSIREYGAVRIYYCKFYSESTLIRYFIPCYRKSDGVRGLYDNVNNAFYTNNGSGTFGIGGAV